MRIANYYPTTEEVGRNDGNPLYVTNTLRKMFELDNVVHLTPRNSFKGYGDFDLHFYIDFGEDAFPHLFKKWTCPKPNVCWMSDTHLGYDFRLEKSREFDVVFVAQKDAMEKFRAAGVNALWLPHAAEPEAYDGGKCIKKYDFCFNGNLNTPDRVDALDVMFKEFPNFYWGTRRFNDAARKYRQSRVNFNIAVKNDINMRMFEVMCSGGFLLTTDLSENGMNDVFPEKEGKLFEVYKTLEEAKEKCHYWIEHEKEREVVAEAGMKYVRANHTFEHRVRVMLTEALPFIKSEESKEQARKCLGISRSIST